VGRKSEWSGMTSRFSTLIILDTPETGGMDEKQEMSFGELEGMIKTGESKNKSLLARPCCPYLENTSFLSFGNI